MWSPSSQPDAKQQHALRQAATMVVRTLQEQGFETYWAGGCVRDQRLGQEPCDYDIATAATPDQVLQIFPRANAVGKSFGVVIVARNNFLFEVATFRIDRGYSDGRHPDAVEFATAAEDAQRRDFTINAMFYDPIRDQLHDFIGGEDDLANGLIRCVGNPAQRFQEDHLRMLRAVRFAHRLGFQIDPATANAIKTQAASLAHISPERIRDELTRILIESQRAGQAVWTLEHLGLLPVFLPEVSALQHQPQPPEFHPEGDVLTHTLMMLDDMQHRTPALVYAVLLHDIAKPATATHDGQRIRFHGHAELGARMAESILRRLRMSNALIEEVCIAVRGHMRFMEVQNMRKATLRRLVGGPYFPTEMELHRLDCRACHGMLDNYSFLKEKIRAFEQEPVLPDPWIRGEDIIALGIHPGPRIGKLLKKAYDQQLEGNIPNREALLQWLRQTTDHSPQTEDSPPKSPCLPAASGVAQRAKTGRVRRSSKSEDGPR
ncbi:MAG: CCA tRNA nucleotidyltransferase, partial [Kiritimatiellia bacterium]